MPPKVAAAGRKELSGKFYSRTHENYEVSLFDAAAGAGIEKFWEVDNNVLHLAERLAAKVPSSGSELIHIAQEEGCGDMFPSLDKGGERDLLLQMAKFPFIRDGPIRSVKGKIAPDTLLTLAGLASFSADQAMLDERIRNIIE